VSSTLAGVVRLVPFVVGPLFELSCGIAMTLGSVSVAEHVGDLRRLALVARGSLVSRGRPIVRSALPGALFPILGSHTGEASAGDADINDAE
jgi:hypothetical protein